MSILFQRISVLVLLAALALLASPATSLAAEPNRSEATSNADTPPVRDDLSPDAALAAEIINQLRSAAGLPPLRVDPLLNRAATGHIAGMIASGVYGHTGADGSRVADRVARTGYVVDGWIGENWAVFQSVPQAIDWWMTDPPHRENVLNPRYAEMGIGVWPHPGGWGLILVVDFSTGQKAPVAAPEVTHPAEPETPQASEATVPRATVSEGADAAVHVIASGDTLYGIGQLYGIDWEQIARLNGLGPAAILQVGAVLRLTPEVEAAAAEVSAGATPGGRAYTVQAGDSLWSIAANAGLELSGLLGLNGLSLDAVIYPGQVLKLP